MMKPERIKTWASGPENKFSWFAEPAPTHDTLDTSERVHTVLREERRESTDREQREQSLSMLNKRKDRQGIGITESYDMKEEKAQRGNRDNRDLQR